MKKHLNTILDAIGVLALAAGCYVVTVIFMAW